MAYNGSWRNHEGQISDHKPRVGKELVEATVMRLAETELAIFGCVLSNNDGGGCAQLGQRMPYWRRVYTRRRTPLMKADHTVNNESE